MELLISLPAILVAAALCLLTILLSAWIPARRAAAFPLSTPIRQSMDIHIRPRQVKTSSLSRRLFGFEGMLALKNFRRNRRRYRTTVFSLTISIVLVSHRLLVYLVSDPGKSNIDGGNEL